jgi:hypothetical protein
MSVLSGLNSATVKLTAVQVTVPVYTRNKNIITLVKRKLSLCLIKHNAMKKYMGVEVWLHHS